MKFLKIVVVGDEKVGKTEFQKAYCHIDFKKDYVPSIFEQFSAVTLFDGTAVNLRFWDTSGNHNSSKLRLPNYKSADVIIVCYDLSVKTSCDSITNMWGPEIKGNSKGAEIVLIGLKSDLPPSVSAEDVSNAKSALGISASFECSALENKGIKEIIHEAIIKGLKVAEKRPKSKGQQIYEDAHAVANIPDTIAKLLMEISPDQITAWKETKVLSGNLAPILQELKGMGVDIDDVKNVASYMLELRQILLRRKEREEALLVDDAEIEDFEDDDDGSVEAMSESFAKAYMND